VFRFGGFFAFVRRFISTVEHLIEQYFRGRPQPGRLTFLPQVAQTKVMGIPPWLPCFFAIPAF
jgi:hypothetical protein